MVSGLLKMLETKIKEEGRIVFSAFSNNCSLNIETIPVDVKYDNNLFIIGKNGLELIIKQIDKCDIGYDECEDEYCLKDGNNIYFLG